MYSLNNNIDHIYPMRYMWKGFFQSIFFKQPVAPYKKNELSARLKGHMW